MKAFKGCVNEDCGVYKKKRYKDEDIYCTICGERLRYVCADCWKQMEDNKERYCIICQAKRNDKKDERKEKTKGAVKKAAGVAIAAGPALATVAKNLKQIEQSGRVIKDVGGKVIRVIAKK